MTQRASFVHALKEGLFSMTELCERFGIARKTGYKWWNRYQAGGIQALADQSRAPKSCPHKTPAALVQALCCVREEHPFRGAGMIVAQLRREHPEEPWPSPSTAFRILKTAGLVSPARRRRRHRHPGVSPIEATRPGMVWTADFKGEFRLRSGRYCYPLTVQDAYSRYLLACVALPSTAITSAAPIFQALFEMHGCPATLRTDNGSPFASAQSLGGLSRLSAGWIALGIGHDRIEPGCPQQNGRHERMHRTLKKHTTRPPSSSLKTQQRRFDAFRHEYNYLRPHQALQGEVPADRFGPCLRPMPTTVPEPGYDGHMEVRKVSTQGTVKLFARPLFVSEVLAGEHVAFEEIREGVWNLMYYDLLLARLHEPTWTLHPGHR